MTRLLEIFPDEMEQPQPAHRSRGAGDPLRDFARDLRRRPAVVIGLLRQNGLFTQFEQAIQRQTRGTIPRRIENHFALVIHARQPRPVPFVLRARLQAPPGMRLDYFIGQGIGIVVVDGVIRDFVVAREIVELERSHRSSGSRKERQPKGKKREPLRDPNDPLRIGTSWVAHEGQMATELRAIHGQLRGGR